MLRGLWFSWAAASRGEPTALWGLTTSTEGCVPTGGGWMRGKGWHWRAEGPDVLLQPWGIQDRMEGRGPAVIHKTRRWPHCVYSGKQMRKEKNKAAALLWLQFLVLCMEILRWWGLSAGILWKGLVVSQRLFLYLLEHKNNVDSNYFLKNLYKITLQWSIVYKRMARDGQGWVEFRK